MAARAHAIEIYISDRKNGEDNRQKYLVAAESTQQVLKAQQLPLTSFWPKLYHMTTPSLQGSLGNVVLVLVGFCTSFTFLVTVIVLVFLQLGNKNTIF